MFWVKVYRTPEATVLAACDEDLIGKEFREGMAVLRITASYYGGELVGREELESLIREADIVGLVGEGAVRVAADMGYLSPGDEKRVCGVPHVNIYKL